MMPDVSFGIAFIAGLLSFMSPCVLPLVPAYIGYMGGRMTHTLALQGAGKRPSDAMTTVQRANMLAHSLMFVAGFTVVFVSIGLATTALFSVLGSTAALMTDIISRLGGVIIILFGLHFMGALRWLFKRLRQYPILISTPITTVVIGGLLTALLLWGMIEPIAALPFIAAVWLWLVIGGGFQHAHSFWLDVLNRVETALYSDTRRDMSKTSANAGVGGSFFMGVVFSAGWTPCIGPIYGTILTVAANTGDVAYALPLLLAYSLGLGVPFVLAAVLMGQTQQALRKLQRHVHRIELVTGSLLVLIGIMVASGQMTRLTQVLNNDFADLSIRIEECGVGVFQERLTVAQVGDCLNGTLHTLVLRQSSTVTLSAEGQQQFVLPLEAGQRINIEISDYPTGFAPLVSIANAEGQQIAQAVTPSNPDGAVYLALADVNIPISGRYTVTVSGDEGRFRFRAVLSPQTAATLPTNPLPVATITEVAQQTDRVGAEVGNAAPSFSVITRDNEVVTLAGLRGKVVVVNFWGTWCAPCEREMPELQSLYERFQADGLVIIGLAVKDTPEAVDAFVVEHGLTFHIALDDALEITRSYGVIGQPTTLLIGKDGIIQHTFHSVITADVLTPLIEDALTLQG
ncbi:MAG: cytochrome c biogenesis protein CcdA [Anaerolineae bacterium]